MLQKLVNFGKKKGYFEIKPLKDIDRCPCKDISFPAIDFDVTKQKVCEEASQQTRASCDALIFTDCLDFIEFKRFKEFLRSVKSSSDFSEQVDNKIEHLKNSLKDKFEDSWWILDYILRRRELSLTKEERQYFYSLFVNYLILVDFSLQQDSDSAKRLAFKIALLGHLPSSLDYNFQEMIYRQISQKLKKLCKGLKSDRIYEILPIDCEGLKSRYSKVNILEEFEE